MTVKAALIPALWLTEAEMTAIRRAAIAMTAVIPRKIQTLRQRTEVRITVQMPPEMKAGTTALMLPMIRPGVTPPTAVLQIVQVPGDSYTESDNSTAETDGSYSEPDNSYIEPEAPETDASYSEPETSAPETDAPYTEPETSAPETDAPYTEPETSAPETDAPYTEPGTSAPETEAPETEAPATEDTSSSSDLGQQIASYAVQFVGNPYVYGGTSLTNGADCSGFVQSVFANFGIGLSRTAASQASGGTSVSLDSLQAGDLLFYASSGSIDHVALYIGGGQIVHAANSASGIIISNAYYSTPVAARRYW